MAHKKCDECKIRRGRFIAYEVKKPQATPASFCSDGIKMRKIILCKECYNKIGLASTQVSLPMGRFI